MNKRTRITATALAILFVAFIVLSFSFMLIEAGHDCIGGDCPICEQIAAVTGMMRTAAVLLLIAATLLPATCGVKHTHGRCLIYGGSVTPVTLKIKLLN